MNKDQRQIAMATIGVLTMVSLAIGCLFHVLNVASLHRRVEELERWQQETRPCWVLRGIPGEAATVDTPSLPPLRARASRSTADGAGTSNENDESHEKRVR